MKTVFFMNKFGKSEISDIIDIPRIGDTIPIFYEPYPKVIEVIWFPHKVLPELKDTEVDAIVIVK